MPWREYLDRHSHHDHLVWCAWFSAHQFSDIGKKAGDPYRFEVGEHVSKETWERWQGKVAGAKFAMLAKGATAPQKTAATHPGFIEVFDPATKTLVKRPVGGVKLPETEG